MRINKEGLRGDWITQETVTANFRVCLMSLNSNGSVPKTKYPVGPIARFKRNESSVFCSDRETPRVKTCPPLPADVEGCAQSTSQLYIYRRFQNIHQ